ncbi:DUF167 domain-containing protein [Frankia sp. Cppng1_Ct_nod]|uniref:DUF167 domain-containing protein n=1 Tax=Frankia sp. Cppng1_Ct_nod TaxID=2897162 RepID=UPI0032EA396E
MRLTIRVRPGSARTSVGGHQMGGHQMGGRHETSAGDTSGEAGMLIVRVTAPAVDGRATESALRALATAFGVRRREVVLVRGSTSRTKIVEIGGMPEPALRTRLAELRAPPGDPAG